MEDTNCLAAEVTKISNIKCLFGEGYDPAVTGMIPTNQIRSCLCLFALEEYFLILEHTTNYMSIGATASCHKKMTHMPRFNGC